MSSKGMTLVEALVALSILGIALTGMVPSLMHFMHANSHSEQSSDAVAVAQTVLEGLRREDPSLLPSSGSETKFVEIGHREYEVVTQYCQLTQYCSATSRHVVVEVSYGGTAVYDVEAVYTRLQ